MAQGFSDRFSGRGLRWNVGAIMPEESCRALQWAVQQTQELGENIQISRIGLADLKKIGHEFDVLLLLLDLGQPVPFDHLSGFKDKVGLCAMVQPTPIQLLQIAKLPHWRGVQMEPGDYHRLAADLIENVNIMKKQIQDTLLIESVENWVEKKMKVPAQLVLLDAPKALLGPSVVPLMEERGSVSVGASDSSAVLRLPIKGKQVFFELLHLQGRWIWRRLMTGTEVKIEGPSSEKALEAGDSFTIEQFQLLLKPSRGIEELTGILYQSGLRTHSSLPEKSQNAENVHDLLKDYMLSALSGELRIMGPTRKASVFLEGGRIQQVLCGAVYGVKALTRIFSWNEFRWTFNLYAAPETSLPAMDLSYLELRNLYKQWSNRWARVGALAPTGNLKIRARPEAFLEKNVFNKSEYTVLAAVCEFGNVNEILNNCPLWDVEIIETLVDLRKQQFLLVH